LQHLTKIWHEIQTKHGGVPKESQINHSKAHWNASAIFKP